MNLFGNDCEFFVYLALMFFKYLMFFWPSFDLVFFQFLHLGSFRFWKMFSETDCMFSSVFQWKSLVEWFFTMSRKFLLPCGWRRHNHQANYHQSYQSSSSSASQTHYWHWTSWGRNSFCFPKAFIYLLCSFRNQARVGNLTCVWVLKFAFLNSMEWNKLAAPKLVVVAHFLSLPYLQLASCV